jgi:hypothetical protein
MVPNFNRSVTISCRMGSNCLYHVFSSFLSRPHCCCGVHARSVCSLAESGRWYHGSLSACVDSTKYATCSRMLMKDCILLSSVCVQCSSRCSSLPILEPSTGLAILSGTHAGQNLSANLMRRYFPVPPCFVPFRTEGIWVLAADAYEI